MRTRISMFVVLLVMSLGAGACASTQGPKRTNPTAPPTSVEKEDSKETSEQKKVRLEADKKAIESGDIEAEVRARAAQIKRQNELDDARRAVAKEDTPEMREARRQLQKDADDASKRRREIQQVDARARPTGCGNSILVNPGAVNVTGFTDSVTIRVTNASSETYAIETSFRDLGPVVEYLCPGGSVSLAFARKFADPQRENIVLTAISMGEKIATRTFTATLRASRGTQGVRRENEAWVIR